LGNQRRKTSWNQGPQNTGTNITGTGPVLGTSRVDILASAITLVRFRGYVRFYLSTANAALSGFQGAIGIAKATTAAVIGGVGVVPTPRAEENWDGWIYHRYIDVRAITATIADGVNAAAVNLGFEIDSKAMRKMTVDESIYVALEVTEEGTATMRWEFDSRMLVKLP